VTPTKKILEVNVMIGELCFVGAADGARLSTALGAIVVGGVGETEGSWEGFCVGCADGSADGFADGVAEGDTEELFFSVKLTK